ncbi:hypothetical protein [Paraconexibacter sp.]|uniref:hypothetical protein n=1 Tax=Paraconexibacter sp. TaxID=2949640 RepID=UPI00356B6094
MERLSYANVMATIAVFIALGGTSYAALKVTGKDVVDRSLTGADIKKRSVQLDRLKGALPAGRDGLPGTPGPVGVKGDTGAKGDTGPQGATGAQGAKGDAGAPCLPADPACRGPKGDKGDRGAPGSNATINGVAAGGALSGTYPSPSIAPGAVGFSEIDRQGFAQRQADLSVNHPGPLPSGTVVRGRFAILTYAPEAWELVNFPVPLLPERIVVDDGSGCGPGPIVCFVINEITPGATLSTRYVDSRWTILTLMRGPNTSAFADGYWVYVAP